MLILVPSNSNDNIMEVVTNDVTKHQYKQARCLTIYVIVKHAHHLSTVNRHIPTQGQTQWHAVLSLLHSTFKISVID